MTIQSLLDEYRNNLVSEIISLIEHDLLVASLEFNEAEKAESGAWMNQASGQQLALTRLLDKLRTGYARPEVPGQVF